MSTKQTAVIIIPTYNEAGSIGEMIDTLCKDIFPKISDWNCKLLIVDDTSPDGTYKIVQSKQKKYSSLELFLNPTKSGIGGAYVKGFRYAIKELKADVVVEFDGDFQHPPETIPQLLKEIDNGYDYVVGSRKIDGGSVPKSWDLKRKFFTYVGGFVGRFILFFPFKYFWQVTDPTTGLKASRVKGFVDHLDMDHLYSKNFGYKFEFFFQMTQLGAKVKEIPLKFGLRQTGVSKISGNTAKDILFTSIKLRWHDPFVQKFLKFGTVGFIGYLVNASLLQLVSNLSGTEWLAWGISTEAAIISNFTLNNLWTFKSDQISGVISIVKKFLQFNFTSLGALLIQTTAGTIGVSIFGAQYRQLLLPFIIVFLVLPYNWIMYNKIIWKKK